MWVNVPNVEPRLKCPVTYRNVVINSQSYRKSKEFPSAWLQKHGFYIMAWCSHRYMYQSAAAIHNRTVKVPKYQHTGIWVHVKYCFWNSYNFLYSNRAWCEMLPEQETKHGVECRHYGSSKFDHSIGHLLICKNVHNKLKSKTHMKNSEKLLQHYYSDVSAPGQQ